MDGRPEISMIWKHPANCHPQQSFSRKPSDLSLVTKLHVAKRDSHAAPAPPPPMSTSNFLQNAALRRYITNLNYNTVTAYIFPPAVCPQHSISWCWVHFIVSSHISIPPSLQEKEKPALLAGILPNTIIHHHFSYHNFFHTYHHAILISLSFYAFSSKY
jgi:hypothetical protein